MIPHLRMKKMSRDPVTAIILDVAQAEGVQEDLSAGLSVGGKTFLIVIDPNNMGNSRHVYVGESLEQARVPVPDVMTHGQTFTVALADEIDWVISTLYPQSEEPSNGNE